MSSLFGFGKNESITDFSNAEIDKIVPKNFILVPSGTYQDQQHRAWETNKSVRAINQLARSIEAVGATSINESMLAKGGGVLHVGRGSQGSIAIPGSWSGKRGIFMLVIDFYMRAGSVERYIIQGFTDSGEFTNNLIAPQLTFYVNNIVNLRPFTTTVGGVAKGTGYSLQRNYQPLQRFGLDSSNATPASTLLLRPQDILSRTSNSQLTVNDGYSVTDNSLALGAGLQTSRRMNSIPSTMSTRLINSYISAAVSSVDDYDVTMGDIAEKAHGDVAENEAIDDSFLQLLRGHSAFNRTNFTWSTLSKAVPGIESVRPVMSAAPATYRLSESNRSDVFTRSNDTTHTVVNLQSSIPSLMLECMIASCSFRAHNLTHDHQVAFQFVSLQAFDESIESSAALKFEARFKREVAPVLSNSTVPVEFDMVVDCQFNGDFSVRLKVGDEEETSMVSPAFCDTLYAPVMSGNEQHATAVADTLATTCAALADSVLTTAARGVAKQMGAVDSRDFSTDGIKSGDIIGMGMSNGSIRQGGAGQSAAQSQDSALSRLIGGSANPLASSLSNLGQGGSGTSNSILGGGGGTRRGWNG